MFSFFKKKQGTAPDNSSELKAITENLYKQNLEIATRNKIFSLLSKLYEISVLTLEPKELTKRIAQVIQADFAFELVGIFIFSEEGSELFPLSVSDSKRFHELHQKINIDIENIAIRNIEQSDFFSRLAKEKVVQYSENFSKVWSSAIPDGPIKIISEDGHIRSSIAYPLIINDKIIGSFIICINRIYSDLVNYEKESIKSFADVISIALDKSIVYQKLADANAGQKTLIHVMNHQIKGFLGACKNIFAELMTDDYGKMPEATLPLLQKGLEETNDGVDYVTQILRGASAESGSIIYDMHELDLKALLEKAYAEKIEGAKKKGLATALDIKDGNYTISADEKNLFEALKNLIDNSINYTPAGNIWVSLSKKDGKALIAVKDTGIGVREEDKPKLFKAGGITKDSIRVNIKSSGYGLAFVKGVAEAHKGKVWLESEGEGKGSTFYLELPAKSA